MLVAKSEIPSMSGADVSTWPPMRAEAHPQIQCSPTRWT